MIQRIQTLYLALVVVGCISLFFSPIATFIGDFSIHRLSILGIEEISGGQPQVATKPLLLITGTVMMAILAIVTIFLYKNRLLQLRLNRFNFLINILLIAGLFWQTDKIEKELVIRADYKIGVFIPIITLLLLILATRGIRKDEAKVRAASRLR